MEISYYCYSIICHGIATVLHMRRQHNCLAINFSEFGWQQPNIFNAVPSRQWTGLQNKSRRKRVIQCLQDLRWRYVKLDVAIYNLSMDLCWAQPKIYGAIIETLGLINIANTDGWFFKITRIYTWIWGNTQHAKCTGQCKRNVNELILLNEVIL